MEHVLRSTSRGFVCSVARFAPPEAGISGLWGLSSEALGSRHYGQLCQQYW